MINKVMKHILEVIVDLGVSVYCFHLFVEFNNKGCKVIKFFLEFYFLDIYIYFSWPLNFVCLVIF